MHPHLIISTGLRILGAVNGSNSDVLLVLESSGGLGKVGFEGLPHTTREEGRGQKKNRERGAFTDLAVPTPWCIKHRQHVFLARNVGLPGVISRVQDVLCVRVRLQPCGLRLRLLWPFELLALLNLTTQIRNTRMLEESMKHIHDRTSQQHVVVFA